MYHSHEVVQYVVTETFGDPSMSVSGAKKSRLKRNDMYFIHALYTHLYNGRGRVYALHIVDILTTRLVTDSGLVGIKNNP